jgi:hypothetical protein
MDLCCHKYFQLATKSLSCYVSFSSKGIVKNSHISASLYCDVLVIMTQLQVLLLLFILLNWGDIFSLS